MADGATVNSDVLDEIANALEGMATTDLPRLDRAGLKAVNAYVKPALKALTPIALQVPSKDSNALKPGDLRKSVRSRITQGEGDRGQAAVTDFGKNNYVANFVDGGTQHSAAFPFVRRLQDSATFQSKSQEAYVSAVEEEVRKVLSGF